MPKQVRGTYGGTGGELPGGPYLPDLTGVDLHALRAMDDPGLLAAVDEVLAFPERYAELWWGADGGDAGGRTRRHAVPAVDSAGPGAA